MTASATVCRARSTGRRLTSSPANGAGGFGDTLGPFSGCRRVKLADRRAAWPEPHPDLVGLDQTRTTLVMLAHNGRTNLKPLVADDLTRPSRRSSQRRRLERRRQGRRDHPRRPRATGSSCGPARATGSSPPAGCHGATAGSRSPTSPQLATSPVTGDPDLSAEAATGSSTIFPGNGGQFQAPIQAPSTLRTFNQIGSGSWNAARSARLDVHQLRRVVRAGPSAAGRRTAAPTTGCFGPGTSTATVGRTWSRGTRPASCGCSPGTDKGFGAPPAHRLRVRRPTAGG